MDLVSNIFIIQLFEWERGAAYEMMGNECIHASKEMLLAVCKDIT